MNGLILNASGNPFRPHIPTGAEKYYNKKFIEPMSLSGPQIIYINSRGDSKRVGVDGNKPIKFHRLLRAKK